MILMPLILLGLGIALIAWVQLVRRVVAPRIEVDLTCRNPSIAYGEKAEIAITLRNPGRLPCPLVNCQVVIPAGLKRETDDSPEENSLHEADRVPVDRNGANPPVRNGSPAPGHNRTSFTLSLQARESVTVRFEVIGRQRGRHSIQSLTVKIRDGFTAHEEIRSFPFFVTVTVHPRRIGAAQIPVLLNLLDTENSLRKLSPTSVDWIDMRPYDAHDTIRDIAWMTSARRGELIVLERAYSMSQSVMIVTSVRASERLWEQRADFADRVYETAYAMIEELSKRGAQFQLFSDGYWAETRSRFHNHLALRGDGAWTPHFQRQTGHVLGSLASYASISLAQILDEIAKQAFHPARIVVLAGFEDETVRQSLHSLKRRGYPVDVVRLDQGSSDNPNFSRRAAVHMVSD